MPENEETPDLEQVRRDFRRVLNERPDIGAAKIIYIWLFEPRNIFDPQSRNKPKQEILLLFSYFVLMTAVFAAFNLR